MHRLCTSPVILFIVKYLRLPPSEDFTRDIACTAWTELSKTMHQQFLAGICTTSGTILHLGYTALLAFAHRPCYMMVSGAVSKPDPEGRVSGI
jgi:hypothetical protein